MRLGLAIPLYNEAESITEVVASIHAALEVADIDYILALVNNGSTDATGQEIDSLSIPGQIECIHLRENAGYGGGILAGLAHLELDGTPDVIGWCWGDGQVSASALRPLFEAIQAGADLAKVERTERQDGLNRQIVTTTYAAAVRLLGIGDRDVNGCPKLMSRAAFEAIQPRRDDWFIDAEVIIKAESLGLNVVNHPVTMRPRRAGKSKVRLQTIAEFVVNLGRWKLTGRT